MQQAIQAWGRIAYFSYVMVAFWIIGGILLLSLGYVGSFDLLNKPFHPQGDYFFPFVTFLGDASVLIALFVLFFWKKSPQQVIILLLSIIITGIIAQVLKKWVFADMVRPVQMLGESYLAGRYYEYPGIPIERLHSFPSGHSITAAAGFTVWAFQYPKQWLPQVGLALLVLAILQSRIYLGVHFLGDVFASSLIGYAVSFRLVLLHEQTYERWEKWISRLREPLFQQAGIGIALGILIVNGYLKIIKVFF